jgi:dihydroorotase
MDKLTLDLLLKGGHVIDPANHIDEPMDVGVAAGKIALVAKSITSTDASQVVDVSGLIVPSAKGKLRRSSPR